MAPKTNGKNKLTFTESTGRAHCVTGFVLGAGSLKKTEFINCTMIKKRFPILDLKHFIVNFLVVVTDVNLVQAKKKVISAHRRQKNVRPNSLNL